MTPTYNDHQETDTRESNLMDKTKSHGKNKRNSQTSDTIASYIHIQSQTQVTLMETKLDAYTSEFRVNQSNFDDKITNTVNNAITKALK